MSVIPELLGSATFESYQPRNQRDERTLALIRDDPGGSWYLTGDYGNAKTYLLYAQYREIVMAGETKWHVRTTRELVKELRSADLDHGFVSPPFASASRRVPYHLFWDDIDKLKTTDFKTEVQFDLLDTLYRQKHSLTVTGNLSLRDLLGREHLHPAIVRRVDDMCIALEVWTP
jgi:DNA replication protein DnaC